MNHIQKKKCRMSSAISVLLFLSVSSANEQEMSLGGTDMSLEDLVNIKVKVASKSEESISDAPGVISVITQDQLKRFGGTTLGDVLKRVPSFLGTTVYMTDRSVIASRGDQVMPSSSHILFLINGRPIREVLEGGIKSEIYESFPVTVIERIEVIRGPGSVLYGSQAFSAVINVVTKSPDYNSVTVSGALGKDLHNHVSANLNYKIGDFGMVFAGRYADKGGWNVNWQAPGLGQIDNIDVTIPDYGPGLYGELSFKGLRLMGSINQWSNQYFVPDFQIVKYVAPEVMPYGDATGRVTWEKYFADLGFEHEFNDFYSFSINATATRSKLEMKMFPFSARDAYEILVEETNHFTPIENFNILLGGVFGFMTGTESDKLKNRNTNEGHEQINFSGYLQLDYRWDWCKAIGGIQLNKVKDFDLDVNPRAGLIFYPFDNVNIKALYSSAYRAPSLDELYLNHETMRGQMVERLPGEPQEKDLKPEKVNSFDLGVNYQDSSVQFGLNGFYSKMNNLIIQDRTGRFEIPTWDNIGKVTIFGLECEGKYYITREWLIEGSILYQESRDKQSSEGNAAPLPTFSAKGGLSYHGYGLTVSAFNSYWQALDKRFTSKMNKTTNNFNMLNLNCSYNFNHLIKSRVLKELSITFAADNLLDEEVWLPAWGLSDLSSRIPYNEGRTLYGGFKVTF